MPGAAGSAFNEEEGGRARHGRLAVVIVLFVYLFLDHADVALARFDEAYLVVDPGGT